MEIEGQVISKKGGEILNNLLYVQENLIKETIEDIRYLNEIIPNFAFSEIIKKNFFNSENTIKDQELSNDFKKLKSAKLK